MSETERFINELEKLKPGDLGLLRTHGLKGLDETVHGFDLFAGLWWPLRQDSPRAPRREVAWLVAKLYAFRPIPQEQGQTLARQLRKCRPTPDRENRFMKKFDRMLIMPIREIEPHLQWALDELSSKELKLDWVKLTDDLSIWNRGSKRMEWAKQFLAINERRESC